MSHRRSVGTLLIAVALFGCRRDVARLDDVQKIAYGAKPGVVRINAYAKGEFRYPTDAIRALAAELDLPARSVGAPEAVVPTGAGGSGSGFIVHPNGFILTSGHVVAPTRDAALIARELRRNGAIAALVKHFPIDALRALHRGEGLDRYIDALAAAGRLEKTSVVNRVELSNGETLPFQLVRYSPSLSERGTDLALLRIQHRNLPVLRLGDSDTVRVGDTVWAVGYPAVASSTDDVIGGWLSSDSDLEPTFVNGTITAIKRNVTNAPVLQSNVAIYRGNSGGPAVNRDGDVVAIATWGHSEAEQIKFLVPINIAKQMMAGAGVAADFDGEFNRHYRAALDAAYLGKWIDARRALEAAGRVFPKSPDVLRFRNDVDRAVRSMPLWVLHPAATVSMLLLCVVAVAALVLQSRRRSVAASLPTPVVAPPEVQVSPASPGTPLHADDSAAHPFLGGGAQMLGRFTILNGSRAGEKLGLGGSGIRIGRERTICEIVLEDPKVSRLHAEVVSMDGKVLLIDRNSSNGTFVNDQKIEKRFLQDGDIIYFGGRNAVAVAFQV